MNKISKILIVLCLGFSLCACTKNEIIDNPEVLNSLDTYDGVISNIDIEETYSIDIALDKDEPFLQVFSCQVDETAHFKTKISGFKEAKNIEIKYDILDDNSNSILELSNKKSDFGEFDLIANKTYYIAFLAEGKGNCTLTVETKKTKKDIESDEIKDELTTNVDTSSYQTAYFNPQKDGFYNISIEAEGKDDVTVSIYSILKDGKEEVGNVEGLCWLEKDSVYYIVYAVEEYDGMEVEVTLHCNYIESVEAKDLVVIESETVIQYIAQEDANIVVYTISDIDPSAVVRDDTYQVIAQNNDADGLYSENLKDVAMLMHVQKGKEYFIHMQNIDGNCEVHFEKYEE